MLRGIETPEQILLLILSLAASLLFAWWTYRDTPNLSPVRTGILILLRGLAVFILILLLFNPVLRRTQILIEKPVIGILLDNSKSVALEKGEYRGETSYKEALDPLVLNDTSDVSYRFYSFDHQTQRIFGQPDLTGSTTDINQAFSDILQAEPDMKGLIIYSDGIFNRGRDPVYTMSGLQIPVISVGLGDTTHIRDIVVRNINLNDVGYRNTITPITGEILNDGFPDIDFEVQLRNDGEIVDRKTVTTTDSRSVFSVQFNVELTETGLQLYEIYIPEIPGEWTTSNNRAGGTIEVLDDQLRVKHIAFEIHPDAGAVRNLLATDETIRLSTLNWFGGDSFTGGELSARLDTLDLVVLHGFPNRQIPQTIYENIIRLMDEVPVILFSTPDMDHQLLTSDLGNRLPVMKTMAAPAADVQLRIHDDTSDHPVMDLPPIDIQRSPVLRAPVSGVEASLGSNVLFNAGYRNEDTNSPVIALRTITNNRIAHINAFGLYRWLQSTNENYSGYMTNLLNNIVKWTSNIPDNRLLTIEPLRPVFDESEQIRFEATLRNESGILEQDALIEISIRSDENVTGTYTMTNRGLGRYSLEIPSVPAGSYSFETIAKKGNTILDEESGNFSVNETNLEYLDLMRNDALLQSISLQSGGRYLTFNEATELPSVLRELDLLRATETELISNKPLYQSPIWFILVVLLLTSEWIIRKSSALI
jgi:hypothetical protein